MNEQVAADRDQALEYLEWALSMINNDFFRTGQIGMAEVIVFKAAKNFTSSFKKRDSKAQDEKLNLKSFGYQKVDIQIVLRMLLVAKFMLSSTLLMKRQKKICAFLSKLA